MDLDSPDGPFYTSSASLRTLLSEFGVPSQQGRKASRWTALPSIAILGINYKPKDDEWHWVVFIRERSGPFVYDPWNTETNRRTEFGRMRLRSCIAVHTQPCAEAEIV